MEGGMAQRAPKGSMKQVSRPMISKQQPSTSPQKWSSFWGFASGCASGLCFEVCFGGMLRKSATFHQYISRTTEKILTHIYIYIYIIILKINHKDMLKKMLNKTEKITKTCHQKTIFHKSDPPQQFHSFRIIWRKLFTKATTPVRIQH